LCCCHYQGSASSAIAPESHDILQILAIMLARIGDEAMAQVSAAEAKNSLYVPVEFLQ
jgi:hypothetical protein